MSGVPYFHEQYNMSPSKAGKMLMSTARSHAKGKRVVSKGKAPVKGGVKMGGIKK